MAADSRSPLQSKPARGSSEGTADGDKCKGAARPAGGSGSTLFERMANLSRGSAPRPADDRDEDDDDTGGALNIPRFLGRQNNQ